MNRSAFALTAIIVLGAAQAHADTIVVNSHGLNLAKPADAHRMTQRIENAALDVCGAGAGSSVFVVRDVKRSACFRDAVRTAVVSTHTEEQLASR